MKGLTSLVLFLFLASGSAIAADSPEPATTAVPLPPAPVQGSAASTTSAQDSSAELAALRKENEALRTENETLKITVRGQLKTITALNKQIADLKATDAAAPAPTADVAADNAKVLIHPLLDQPNSLKNLLAAASAGKKEALGFFIAGPPLRIGVTGHVSSVWVERIIDKTNMVAQIGGISVIQDVVWIAGIDTSGLVDNQRIFLTEPLQVTGTVDAGGATIFRLTRAEKDP